MSTIEHRMLTLNGINAATGEPLLSPTLAQIAACASGEQISAGEREELRQRAASLREDHLDACFQVDLRDLAATGWGVIFPDGRQDELRTALAPLLALRKSQAGRLKEHRYRELVGHAAESKARFLARHGIGPGPADPDVLPYYLMIVGSPAEISFRFQYQLDMQYGVGRLCFSTLEEYANYARGVVAAEMGEHRANRRVSFFGVSHPGDPATASSLKDLVTPLAAHTARDRPQWEIETVFGPEATKAALSERMGGARTPALLFTAGHGMGFPLADPRHAPHQGALLCQDWPGSAAWRGRIPQDHYLAGDDIPDSAAPAGLISFLFACYGAGTPLYDNFLEGEQRQIATESFVARLPQRLLGHPQGGALAVVGHIDRAWTFSFDWPEAGAQLQVFESALGRLLEGYPVGAAMEYFNQRYAELFTDLLEEREEVRWGAQPDFMAISEMWTAANDARSYVVLGDPAVRLAAAVTEGK
jgi:hypothetical protein